MNDYLEEVTVVEMLPRDGFQRLDRWIPTETKIEIINSLSKTGVDEIEFTSFTHPDVVPNLKDADEVARKIDRAPKTTYRALVPNLVGAERASEANIDKVNALITCSPEYNQKNQGMTIEENIDEIGSIVDHSHEQGIEVEAGIGMSFFSPYEGRTPPERTLSVVEAVVSQGVDEVTLATSMGMADPRQTADLLARVFERYPDIDLGLHLHDTNGMSLANTLAALQMGVERFDTSVCGLGGGVILPETLQGVGNTPTEDLVQMLHEMEIETGVDFASLQEVATNVKTQLGLKTASNVLKGGTKENVLSTIEQE